MPEKTEHTTFYVGDSDLVLLGLAAALAARYQARRKSGVMRGWEGYPQSDEDAKALLERGLAAGELVPPDDVPELHVAIHATGEVLQRLRDMLNEIP